MRQVLLGVLCFFVLGFACLYVHEGRASATPACTPPCVGYFNGGVTNSYPGDATNILSGGLNANDAGSMAGILFNYLNFGSYQDQIGAAFIIDQMLGQGSWAGRGGAAAGVAYARANFGTWQNLVNYYASSANPAIYGVQWNVWRVGVDPNSAFFFDINDDAYHRYIPGVDDGPVIRFYWAGGEFLIQRVCGNLEGVIGRVPTNSAPYGSISVRCDAASGQQIATFTLGDPDAWTQGHISTATWSSSPPDHPTGGPYTVVIPQSATNPYVAVGVSLYVSDSGPAGSNTYQYVTGTITSVPCVALTCGSMMITPSLIDPFTKFTVRVSVTNNVNQAPPGATMSMRITGPGFTQNFGPQSPDVGTPPSVSQATFSNIGPTNSTGVFTVTWSLNSAAANKTCPDVGQPAQTFPVVNLPYLSVFGGDAMTGASPTYSGGASTCVSNANAGIYGWNNHTTNFSGGGAQYAVQALGQILDFASAQGSTNTPPTGLSFANVYSPADATKLNAAQGLFGGNFGATVADCDFTSDITGAPLAGNQVLPNGAVPATIPNNSRAVEYVNGDVYIANNIVYNTAGWSTPSNIPNLKVVVTGGNIYIDRNVTQLDGLYVAEPSGGVGGTIYTCATGLGAPANPAVPGYYSLCNSKLVVNGSFVAKQVQFLRTPGTLGQAATTDSVSSNHSAEVFNFTPELWLPRNSAVPGSGYNSITGLPPVL